MITVNPKRQVRTISPVAQCDPIIVNPVLTLSTYVKTFYFILGYAAVWKVIFYFCALELVSCVVHDVHSWKGNFGIVEKDKIEWYSATMIVLACQKSWKSQCAQSLVSNKVCLSISTFRHLSQVISVESVHCYDFPLGRERQWWCKKRQHWWLSINTRHPHQFSSLTQVRSAEASHKGKISSSPEVNE